MVQNLLSEPEPEDPTEVARLAPDCSEYYLSQTQSQALSKKDWMCLADGLVLRHADDAPYMNTRFPFPWLASMKWSGAWCSRAVGKPGQKDV